jgi:hypothetical protein
LSKRGSSMSQDTLDGRGIAQWYEQQGGGGDGAGGDSGGDAGQESPAPGPPGGEAGSEAGGQGAGAPGPSQERARAVAEELERWIEARDERRTGAEPADSAKPIQGSGLDDGASQDLLEQARQRRK